MNEEKELPVGWVNVKLDSFSDIVGGSTPSRNYSQYFGGDIVWLTPTEISKDTVSIITDSREKLTEDGFNNSGVRWIPAGSVLLTSRASIGYVAIAGTDVTTNQGFASFILPEGIDPKYLGWWLRSQKEFLEDLAKGTTFKEISKSVLKDVVAPLAPTNEQHRIVSAIEQQFTRLDAAVASLKHAQRKLKLYRSALLKAAVEGKLTEDWRAQHPATESAPTLLQRILHERRAKWEADQLAKMAAKGSVPKDNKWKQAYKEPAPPNTEGLPVLPEGWCWATVEQVGKIDDQAVLTGPFGSNLGREDFVTAGTPVLTIGCLTERGLSLEKAFYISESKASELERYQVKTGDILFSRMASVGRADLLPASLEGSIINYHLMRLRLENMGINAKYFIMYVRGSQSVLDYIKEVNHGVTRDGINTEQLLNLPVALPPLAEQEQIVSLVEEQLSIITEMETTVEHSLRRAERERQSILREAFAGRLIPQDPRDEPASVLLERIWEERKRREEEEQGKRKERGKTKMASEKTATNNQRKPLREVLQEAKQPMTPDDLFKRAGFQVNDVDDFFADLRIEVQKGGIRQVRPDDTYVLLEAVGE